MITYPRSAVPRNAVKFSASSRYYTTKSTGTDGFCGLLSGLSGPLLSSFLGDILSLLNQSLDKSIRDMVRQYSALKGYSC